MAAPQMHEEFLERNMFSVHEGEAVITFEISSERRLINGVVDRVIDFLSGIGVKHNLDLTVVMRELLENAISHGNQGIAQRTVRCEVTHTGGEIVELHVVDEGMGFDHTKLDMTLPDDPRTLMSRGYVLVNALSEELRFNESGNGVTASVNLGRPFWENEVVERQSLVGNKAV